MNYKKVSFLIALPFILQLLLGCCDCDETIYSDYTNCSLEVLHLDNAGESPIYGMDSIPKGAYGMELRIGLNESICYQSRQRHFHFFPTANAFSCDCPPEIVYRAIDSITNIQITTTVAFNGQAVGSDISNAFWVWTRGSWVPITDIWSAANWDISYALPMANTFQLLLLEEPEESKHYEFEVNIELSDGRNLTTSLDPVFLY